MENHNVPKGTTFWCHKFHEDDRRKGYCKPFGDQGRRDNVCYSVLYLEDACYNVTKMNIFASAEENNAALVSGKVTRRFPLIFSGATFPIRLLLVKWRDEPWNVEFFLVTRRGIQKNSTFLRAKPSTEPAKVEWEMSNQKIWVGNQAELWSWPKRSYFLKKEAKLCFPSQQCWDSQVTKNTFFIEKMLEIRCRMANVLK